jgi:predicted DCC family thiol-disulfide oxidoreductase YuxK
MTAHSLSDTVIVYDGDCAFCELWVGRMKRVLPITPKTVTSQSIDLDSFGLTEDDVAHYAWLITPTTQIAGGSILAELLVHQPRFGQRLAGHILKLWPLDALANAVYRVVAKNRHRLPGSTAACESDPTE